ncbi:MAG: four helix bundle protein [Clostridia bacterium]|nr:four helix bundle protein [Clostridia bacterium]
MYGNNVVADKSKAFALRIIKLYKYLINNHKISPIANQILKSGTSIGANIKEAIRAQSKPDFYSKMNIALKESSETEYWLELLYESGYISKEQFESVYADCCELLKILMSITKTQKNS